MQLSADTRPGQPVIRIGCIPIVGNAKSSRIKPDGTSRTVGESEGKTGCSEAVFEIISVFLAAVLGLKPLDYFFCLPNDVTGALQGTDNVNLRNGKGGEIFILRPADFFNLFFDCGKQA